MIIKTKFDVVGYVPKITKEEFSFLANETNKCPVSQLFSSESTIEIETLLQESRSF